MASRAQGAGRRSIHIDPIRPKPGRAMDREFLGPGPGPGPGLAPALGRSTMGSYPLLPQSGAQMAEIDPPHLLWTQLSHTSNQ